MVVLPEPDSPMRATTSRRFTSKLTPLTMGVREPSSLAGVDRQAIDLEEHGHQINL